MRMNDAVNSYAALEKACALVKDLGLELRIEDDEWVLSHETDEYGMPDVDVEELYVTGTTPSELLHFLEGFVAGLRSKKVYEPKRGKKKKKKKAPGQ